MGDNAKQIWSWHNNEIGQGYQAKGVIRQNHGANQPIKVIDMSVNVNSSGSKKRLHDNSSNNDDENNENDDDDNDHKKHKSKSHKKHKKEKSKKDRKKEKEGENNNDKYDKRCNFNPLLQILGMIIQYFYNKNFTVIIIIATRLSNTTRHFSCEGWP